MRQSLRLGRIAGIAVGVHWSVLVIMALLVQGLAVTVLPGAAPGQPWPVYWAAAIGAAGLFLASLLAHELAHALVARRFGIRVERITLWLLGGVAELADEAPTARADLLVAGAGPVTSIAAGLSFGALTAVASVLDAPAVVTGAFGWLAGVNVVLAVFNLLPGAPLDGGRVLRALLWRWHGDRYRAARAAARAGHGLGMVLVFLGVAEVLFTGAFSGLWLALLGWFLVSAAKAEAAAARYHALLGRVPVRPVMHDNPVCGDPRQSVDDFVRTVAVQSGHRAFPLRDAAGHPAGVVRLADLSRVPAAAPCADAAGPRRPTGQRGAGGRGGCAAGRRRAGHRARRAGARRRRRPARRRRQYRRRDPCQRGRRALPTLARATTAVLTPVDAGVGISRPWTRGRPAPACVRFRHYTSPGTAVATTVRDDDLLIVGPRQHGPLRRALLGSVTGFCLNHAGCPVLAVPPRRWPRLARPARWPGRCTAKRTS